MNITEDIVRESNLCSVYLLHSRLTTVTGSIACYTLRLRKKINTLL